MSHVTRGAVPESLHGSIPFVSRIRDRLVTALVLSASAVFIGCSDESPTAPELEPLFNETQGGNEDGRVITRWVDHALDAVRDGNIATSRAGRLYAMVTCAMYDAVNGIDRANGGRRGYAIVPPEGAPKRGPREAAAAAAAWSVLNALAPTHAPQLDEDPALTDGGGGGKDAGRDWGRFVGEQVVLQRSADGTQEPETIPAGTGIGEQRADFDARFRNMTPFGIASKTPHVSDPPPALTSDAYAIAFNDVKEFGVQDGNAERNAIATFWLAGAGTVRETGTWLQAALSIVADKGTDRNISKTARLFALLGMTIADAVTVSWATKAQYFTWRPTFAIHEAALDGNPGTEADPTWTSRFGSVGGSPEYTSGTSTFAGGASRILERFYSAGLDFCFETDAAPDRPRCYSSPHQGALEAGRSRIYQGIHFQFSNVGGRVAGRSIANEVFSQRLRD